MRCPFCQAKGTKVIETREAEDEVTRRRRECDGCGRRFTTYEKLETLSVTVIKKNHEREVYDREKLKAGILRACHKRPIPANRIERMLDEVESEVRQRRLEEIESRELGNMIMTQLKGIDEVAYIRYASVYRKFADIRSFEEEFTKLMRERKDEHHRTDDGKEARQ